MSRSKIIDIVALTKEGWQPYAGRPDKSVYEKLKCGLALQNNKRHGRGPFWFVRGDVFCCIGCANRCVLKNPSGFIYPLPFGCPIGPKHPPYMLTPKEMVERHDLLNAKQAAYCLNVSERTIYNYIAEGKLVRLKENPVRVRASEVKALRENFDE